MNSTQVDETPLPDVRPKTDSSNKSPLDQETLHIESSLNARRLSEISWVARRKELQGKIANLVESMVESVSMGRLPSFDIGHDSWSSVNVETGVLRSNRSSTRRCDLGTVDRAQRFARLMVILKIVHGLLVRNEISTVRQIFYDNVNLFENQVNVFLVLNDIAKLLDCTRRDLNVISTAKGLVSGDLRWQLSGCDEWIDCRRAPVLIPGDLREIQEMETCASIVLIIEKDAIFQKLLDQNAHTFFDNNNLNAVLITGKGVPDLSTRQLIHILHNRYMPRARFFVLTDADAYGIEIAAIYTFGSLAQAHAENYGVPDIEWIGLLPSEIESFNMSTESRIMSKDIHQKRLHSLLKRPWMRFRPQWRCEVLTLISLQCKAEIEALDQFGQTFLLENYVCSKISGNGEREKKGSSRDSEI